jgi:hypothetical protein
VERSVELAEDQRPVNDFLSNYRRVLGDQGEWHGKDVYFRCPFPACAASRSRKLSVDPERGWWCCYRCRQTVPGKLYRAEASLAAGGTAEEFALLMGDDPALWPKVTFDGVGSARPVGGKRAAAPVRRLWTELFARCPLHPQDHASLTARGVDPAAAGFGSVTEEALAWITAEFGEQATLEAGLLYERDAGDWRPRTCVQPGRVLIPYFNRKQEVEYFVGYRRLPTRLPTQTDHDYELRKSRWVKVAGPAGYTPLLYGPVVSGADPLCVTEGQIKALAAVQRGIPMVGLQGMGNGHTLLASQVKAAGTRRVVIVFDSSRENQELVIEEEERLARLLEKAGAQVGAVRLPLEPGIDGGDKCDVDSYLLAHGRAGFEALLARAEPIRVRPKEKETGGEKAEPG